MEKRMAEYHMNRCIDAGLLPPAPAPMEPPTHRNATPTNALSIAGSSPTKHTVPHSAHQYGVINVIRLIIEQALSDVGMPSDVSQCISSFCCDEIRCSVLDNCAVSVCEHQKFVQNLLAMALTSSADVLIFK